MGISQQWKAAWSNTTHLVFPVEVLKSREGVLHTRVKSPQILDHKVEPWQEYFISTTTSHADFN